MSALVIRPTCHLFFDQLGSRALAEPLVFSEEASALVPLMESLLAKLIEQRSWEESIRPGLEPGDVLVGLVLG